ncbi:hypothetical protein L9F63_026183, partial [Diploptera punctata]
HIGSFAVFKKHRSMRASKNISNEIFKIRCILKSFNIKRTAPTSTPNRFRIKRTVPIIKILAINIYV